jgi:hypothetical protein
MRKFSYSIIAVALVSICTEQPAVAGQPQRPAPATSAPQRVVTTNAAPRIGLRQGTPNVTGRVMGGGQKNVAGVRTRGFGHDPRRWNDRDRAAWHHGHAYHECRFGRCGYWWSANGYWYFYNNPVYDAPDLVSEVAYDDQGSPLQAADQPAMAPLLPAAVGIPGDPATAGALIGGMVGGILGNALGGR